LDKIAFSPEECSISSQWLEVLGSENIGHSSLNSIRQDIAIKQRTSAWKYIFAILKILSFYILVVAGVYIVLTWYMLTLKTCIIHTLMSTLPELILHLMQLLPIAPEPNQQPLHEPIH
jgi:hypothetical protein